MKAPMISIITPSLNSEKTICTTIESILKQTYSNIEYIIVDGGSTDKTVEMAESFRSALENRGISYQIISGPDEGIYDAMNKGIRMAKGCLIGIINSDDWYEENALHRVAETYERNTFDMFYADLRIWQEDAQGNLKEKMIKHSRLRKFTVSRDWNHPTTFMTREVYKKYRYKLESVHDDWDLVLRVRKAGVKIVVINEVLANFRMGGVSNEKNLKKCIQRGKARYQIYRNNGYSRWYWWECAAIEMVKWLLS